MAEACGVSKWDMVMQIDVGKYLKLELESLNGHNKRDWDLLVESITEVWESLYTRIKYMIQNLRNLSEGFSQEGGVEDIHKYKVYIFLADFSEESQKSIKKELFKGNEITYGKDGFCKPPAFKDLSDFAKMEMKANSEDTFSYGKAFAESNRVMQQKDLNKGKFYKKR
ncbi:hypothetical protein H4Q26_004846 [Puccinia striiformis f. sp. tritici PST-130]|uniref:Uncharacterized protein n=1 Tax=Puccinia striiformis f. sp. tritici PST-78 TaxID=1165861 RepID=A0A0L0VJL1_9BASI|nr:hypothetical protein H4Q26_004846 [Puccinia striiformis f. sp. tritici PST-130]KNE99411.1 hypothetical protein PSTG_07341 [Puccinia striiformis f. sp. tritici PST-78]